MRRLFSALRPDYPRNDPLEATVDLSRDGITTRPGFLTSERAGRLRTGIADLPGEGIGGATRRPLASISEAQDLTRFDYHQALLLTVPGVMELVSDPDLVGCAGTYLRAQPIFAGINAWWSLPKPNATTEELSTAAQLFHFDYDWPAFVKFFIYLTDVDDSSGPFAFVKGSHEVKPFWRDGRFSLEELVSNGLNETRITGEAGTLTIADTAGFHRGTPPMDGPRLMLQLEYAVSRFGASSQYPLLPAALRPPSPYRHTYDVFAMGR